MTKGAHDVCRAWRVGVDVTRGVPPLIFGPVPLVPGTHLLEFFIGGLVFHTLRLAPKSPLMGTTELVALIGWLQSGLLSIAA